jgi:hypothetical protein
MLIAPRAETLTVDRHVILSVRGRLATGGPGDPEHIETAASTVYQRRVLVASRQ